MARSLRSKTVAQSPSVTVIGNASIVYLNGEPSTNTQRETSASGSRRLRRSAAFKDIQDFTATGTVVKEETVKIEYETDLSHKRDVTPEYTPPSSPKSSRKSTPRKASLARAHPPPKRWQQQLAAIKEMRSSILPPAPVDTMGCDSLPDGVVVPPDVSRFQTLIALMLSSQTKDPVTAAAMQRLREGLPGGLTVHTVLEAPPELINECIKKVGFHNRKTIYIKQTAEILRDEFAFDIPKTVEELCCLPGVGPKMAYLAMQAAWITNRLRWHRPATSDPEMTRVNLESWLPDSEWKSLNWLLVGFGQLICSPIGPKCGSCKLAEEGLCPSAAVTKRSFLVKQVQHVSSSDDQPVLSSDIVKIETLESTASIQVNGADPF